MTIHQYQKLAAAITSRIIQTGSSPYKARAVSFGAVELVDARDPKKYASAKKSNSCHKTAPGTFTSGECNTVLKISSLSNPANPNYKHSKLKPGSILAHDSSTHSSCDLTDFNFDSKQFSKLISLVNNAEVA